jgi:hypothetical protein
MGLFAPAAKLVEHTAVNRLLRVDKPLQVVRICPIHSRPAFRSVDFKLVCCVIDAPQRGRREKEADAAIV